MGRSYPTSYHPVLKMNMSMFDKAFKRHIYTKGLYCTLIRDVRYHKTLKERNIVQSMFLKATLGIML